MKTDLHDRLELSQIALSSLEPKSQADLFYSAYNVIGLTLAWIQGPEHGRGRKFHLSAHNYDKNLERTSNSSQSTCPIGQVLWEDLLEVILHITP